MREYNDDESMKRSKRCFKSLSSLKLSFFFLFSFLSIIFEASRRFSGRNSFFYPHLFLKRELKEIDEKFSNIVDFSSRF